jgi:uncharacterized membrane protein
MADTGMTKVKLAVGGFQLEFEGREAFLKSEVPNLVLTVDKLQAARLAAPLVLVQQSIEQSLSTQKAASDLIGSVKNDLDSMSELGETETLRLQMAMDRLSKMMTSLSNILKKMSDTAESITQNLK